MHAYIPRAYYVLMPHNYQTKAKQLCPSMIHV